MKTKHIVTLLAVMVSLAAGVPVFAHHGNAAYDNEKIVTVKNGIVTDLLWANPHTVIMFDAKDASGKVLHWAVEGGSPSALSNLGWTRDSIQRGDVITVDLYQSKLGRPVGRLNRVVLANGKELRDSAYRAKPGGDN